MEGGDLGMSSIDERVVNMRFNNGQFESGINKSVGSLERLKQGLKNLGGSKSGIAELSDQANRFNLDNMASSVSTIESRFSALGIIASSVLQSITDRAVNAGIDMAKNLSLKPLTDGFAEYELKMGSIQTILANTARHGTTLDDVNASLEDLNTYADKTIYNFGEMTRNIGLFTNAGLTVEASTSMIKGFSNAAAASGTNASAAAGAAYQLSQALSTGVVKAQDWMSITNAGMGNKNMQEGLINIAEAMGTLSEAGTNADEVTADFKGTLEKGWLTADVMSQYLQIMAGDMDDAAMSALGLSDAQIATFREQQKTAEEAATKVRTFTQLVDTMQEALGSSWGKTFEILFGDFEQATELFTGLSERIEPIISGMGDARNELLEGFADLGGREIIIETIFNAFDALRSILGPIGAAFRDVFPPASAETLISIAEKVRDFTEGLILSSETANDVQRTFRGVFAVFSIIGQVIGGVLGVIGDLVGALIGASGGVLDFTGSIGDFLVSVDEALKKGGLLEGIFSGIGAVLTSPIELLGKLGEALANVFGVMESSDAGGFTGFLEDVGTALGNFGEKVMEAVSNLDFNAVFAVINTGLLAAIGLGIKKFFDSILEFDFSGGFIDSIKETFSTLTESIELMQAQVKADMLLKIAIAIGILAASLVALSFIDPKKMATALGGMAVLIGEMMTALLLLSKIDPKSLMSMPVMATALILLATAILILAAAVRTMSDLSWDELARGLVGVAGGLAILVAGAAGLSKIQGGLIRIGAGLILVSAALIVLAKAVEAFSGMEWGELLHGLVGMGGALLVLAGALRLMPDNMVSIGAGLILVGAALHIVAGAVEKVGQIPLGELAKGLGGIAAALLILAGALNLMPANLVSTGAGLIIVGAGLHVMASAIQTMGEIPTGDLVGGLIGVGGALLVIAGAIRLMPKNMVAVGAGLLVVSAGVSVISDAVEQMGGMSVGEIAKGLIALGGSLLILSVALKMMAGSLAGAAALGVAALALSLLAPVLVTLGSLSWQELLMGLGALGGALLVIGGAAMLLAPTIPALLALSVGILAISAAMMLGAGAFALFASALSMLGGPAQAGMAVLDQLIAKIPELMGQIAAGLVQMVVTLGESAAQIATAIAELGMHIITGLLNVIIELAPQIGEAFLVLIMTVLDVINTAGPAIIDTFVILILKLVDAVVAITPAIGNAIVVMITTILDILVAVVPQFSEKGMQILIGFLQGIANNIGQVVTTAVDIIVAFINAIAQEQPRVTSAGVNLVISLINGVAEEIRNSGPALGDAAANLGMAIIEGLAGAILAGAGRVLSAIAEVAGGALEWAKSLLGINSPSKEFQKIGHWVDEGFADGITNSGGQVVGAIGGVISQMTGTVYDGVDKSIQAIDKLHEYAKNKDTNVEEPEPPAVDEVDKPEGDVVATPKTVEAEECPDEPVSKTPTTVSDSSIDTTPADPVDIPQTTETAALRADNSEFATVSGERTMYQDDLTESSETMSDALIRARDSLKELGDYLKDESEDTNKNLRRIAEGMGETFKEASSQPVNEGVKTFIEGMKKSKDEFETLTRDVVETAEKGADELVRIFKQLEEDITASNKRTYESSRETMREMLDLVKDIRGTVEAISDGIEAVRDMAKLLDYTVKRVWGGEYLRRRRMLLSGRDMGHAIVTGMDDGMEEGFTSVENAAAEMGKRAVYTTEKELGFHNKENEFEKMGLKSTKGLQAAFRGMLNLPPNASSKTVKRVFGEVIDEWIDFFEQIEKNLTRLEKAADAIQGISDLVQRAMEFTFSAGDIVKSIGFFGKSIDDVIQIVTRGLPSIQQLQGIASLDWLSFFNFGGILQSGLQVMSQLGLGIIAGTPAADMIAAIAGGSVSTSLAGGVATGMMAVGIAGVIAAAVAIAIAVYLWAQWYGVDKLRETGEVLAGGLLGGFSKVLNGLIDAIDSILAMENIFDKDAWAQIGVDLVSSIIEGISMAGGSILDALIEVIVTTITKAQKDLGINKPTKGLKTLGDKITGGVSDIVGMDVTDENLKASTELDKFSDSLISKMRESIGESSEEIEEDLSLSPTITPVVDMSNVEPIDASASAENAYQPSTLQAYDIAEFHRQLDSYMAEQAEETSGEPASVVYNQYNNSPKALSEIDIYRRTKNQLSMAEKGGKPGDRL